MADYLKTLDHEELVRISADFDYLSATQDFVGLKLLPMVRTENLKVAIYNLMKGHEVRVSALVHAFDSEARLGDRPEYKKLEAQLLLIKEKIDQGEELRKKIKDLGMDASENSVILAIYDDIANEISKVLVGFERRACELLSTGKIVIKENGADYSIDEGFDEDTNKTTFSDWDNPDHDIIGDIIAFNKMTKNKIKRFILSPEIMAQILNNNKLNTIASDDVNQGYLTEDYAISFLQKKTKGAEFVIDDRTYKLSYKDGEDEYRYFPQDALIALTTVGTVGKTLMTSTPIEDADKSDSKYGFVAVHQWTKDDPTTSYTKAEGVGLPVIPDINKVLYIAKINGSV